MKSIKLNICIPAFNDITILGICSNLMDFQLAYQINNALGFNFIRNRDISSDNRLYSFYSYSRGENHNSFNFVSVKTQGVRWKKLSIPLDYLFIIRNEISEQQLSTIKNAIRNIPNVHHIFLVDVDREKEIEPILEDIDNHVYTLK